MTYKKLIIASVLVTGIAGSANAVIIEKTYDQPKDQIFERQTENSNANATIYSANDGQINYRNKNLANYQDPYLSNPRAYQSNEYGDAAPAPKPNVFYRADAPIYNAYEARVIQNDAIEPSSGLYIDADER